MSRFCLRIVTYLVCGLAFLPAGVTVCMADDVVKDEIRVEVTGTLQTGLMAIGGETTGTVISANGVTWELDLRKHPKLQALVDRLNGKKVTVRGTYERRRGVEIPQREIVTVTDLVPAKSKTPAGN